MQHAFTTHGTRVSRPGFTQDAGSIPAQWRGYVAVALQRGFLTVTANRFEPNRAITRLEVVRAINAMML